MAMRSGSRCATRTAERPTCTGRRPSEASPPFLKTARRKTFERRRRRRQLQETRATGELIERAVVLVESTAASNPNGWLVLAGVIASSELVPLLPTQPLSLVSGLLFGASKGCVITLLGTVTAASIAFSLSSGPAGRSLSSLALRLESGGAEGDNGGDEVNPVLKKLGDGVEDMTFWQQTLSIILLRFSPVVPFSLSNYMIGLTPVKFLPFLFGTLVGMSPWCFLYATAGSYASSMLQDGQGFTIDGIEELRTSLQQQLSQYSEEIELVAAGTAFMLGVFIFQTLRKASAEERT